MVRPSLGALLVVFALSGISVALVATEILGTVWLIVGPAAVGAAEIVVSHINPGEGLGAHARDDAPAPVLSPAE